MRDHSILVNLLLICFSHSEIKRYLLSGKPGFTKKQTDLFFPPDFADDFPVAMQVFKKIYHLIFIAIYKCYLHSDPIRCFLWADIPKVQFDICYHKAPPAICIWSGNSNSSLQKSHQSRSYISCSRGLKCWRFLCSKSKGTSSTGYCQWSNYCAICQ